MEAEWRTQTTTGRRPRYDPPRVLRLGDSRSGMGLCEDPGSGDAGSCLSPGSSAGGTCYDSGGWPGWGCSPDGSHP